MNRSDPCGCAPRGYGRPTARDGRSATDLKAVRGRRRRVGRDVVQVEDDPRFSEVVREILESDGFSVRTARSRAEALGLVARRSPDVVLLDLGLPDCRGPDLVSEITALAVPVLVLTAARAPSTVLDAIRAGASGFIHKEDAARRLVGAIDDLLDGRAPLSPDAARALIDEVRATTAPKVGPGATDGRLPTAVILTGREVAVVRQLALGHTYEQVGTALGVSCNTVRTHVRTIYEKLGVSSRTEAVLAALRLGLFRTG